MRCHKLEIERFDTIKKRKEDDGFCSVCELDGGHEEDKELLVLEGRIEGELRNGEIFHWNVTNKCLPGKGARKEKLVAIKLKGKLIGLVDRGFEVIDADDLPEHSGRVCLKYVAHSLFGKPAFVVFRNG